MAYGYEEQALQSPHKITLDGRSKLTMSGISDIESFDENMIVLDTTRGTLVVRGEKLHLQMLSLEGGQVSVDGTVDSLTYENDTRSTGGFLSRLFS